MTCWDVLREAWAYRRVTRFAPSWDEDETAEIQIRQLGNGNVLLTLPAATLAGADLSRRSLPRANLRGVNLEEARLRQTDLQGAYLGYANLHGADLRGAKLKRCSLAYADLRQANLAAADLRSATLLEADLTGAQYDAETRWPSGFSPQKRGCVLIPAGSPRHLPLPAEAAVSPENLPLPASGEAAPGAGG